MCRAGLLQPRQIGVSGLPIRSFRSTFPTCERQRCTVTRDSALLSKFVTCRCQFSMCKACCNTRTRGRRAELHSPALNECAIHVVKKDLPPTASGKPNSSLGTTQFASVEQRRRGGQVNLPMAELTIAAGGFLFHAPSARQVAEWTQQRTDDLVDNAISYLEHIGLRQHTELFSDEFINKHHHLWSQCSIVVGMHPDEVSRAMCGHHPHHVPCRNDVVCWCCS